MIQKNKIGRIKNLFRNIIFLGGFFSMEDLRENASVNVFLLMLKGIAIAMGLTLIMILVLSMVLSFSNISENVMMPAVIFISAFSILIGGFLVAKRMDSKGIVYGSAVGLAYMLILYLTSSFLNFNFSLNFNAIIMIALGILGGAIGGILGVNLK